MRIEIPSALKDVLPKSPNLACLSNPKELKKLLRNLSAESESTPHYVVYIGSLHQYIACIEYMHEELRWNRPIIFRGHADARWKLVPSLMRETLFPHIPDSPEVDSLEADLMRNFKKRAIPLLRYVPTGHDEEWEWKALAQHHNLPTRLLDWTYRAGTALYFAVHGESHADFSCVWAIKAPPELDTRLHRYPNPDMPIFLYNPPHVSPRVTMQQGCFTAHPGHYRKTYFEWIDGARIIFLIPRKVRRKIRNALNAIGINRASVFPDLDGIAEHLAETIPRAYLTHVAAKNCDA